MKKRLLSLDVLRGINICLMVIVNFQVGELVLPQLRHAQWLGFTLADIVYPMFITLVGIAIPFSLAKFGNKLCKGSVKRVVKRSVSLLIVALLLAAVLQIINNLVAGKDLADALYIFDTYRVPGILQRLAVCYFVAAMITLIVPNDKWVVGIIIVILAGYWVFLICTNALEFVDGNIIGMADVTVFGENHLLMENLPDGSKMRFDPEGLIASIPCVAQMLIGYFVGKMLLTIKTNNILNIISKLFVIGCSFILISFPMHWFIDFSKRLWTPAYVFLTCGITICAMAMLLYIIDYKGHKKWCRFFEVFGVNCIFTYVVHEILYAALLVPLGLMVLDKYGDVLWNIPVLALIYSIVMMLIVWLIMYPLYKKKIYIKL